LLTTPNPDFNDDMEMFNTLGLIAKKPFADGKKPEVKETIDATV
jgi:biotin synthase